MTTNNTKICPFCAETIKAAAIKCRFCGTSLVETEAGDQQPATQAKAETSQSSTVLDTPVSMKNPLVIFAAVAGGLVLTAAVVFGTDSCPGSSTLPGGATSSEPAGSATHGVTKRTSSLNSRAIAAAKTLVLKRLKAPSTAKFSTTTVVASAHPHYLVHVVADAQNSFGAMIRGSWCAVIQLSKAAGEFTHNPMASVGECRNPPSADDILTFKHLNDWPGLKPKPKAHVVPPPAPTPKWEYSFKPFNFVGWSADSSKFVRAREAMQGSKQITVVSICGLGPKPKCIAIPTTGPARSVPAVQALKLQAPGPSAKVYRRWFEHNGKTKKKVRAAIPGSSLKVRLGKWTGPNSDTRCYPVLVGRSRVACIEGSADGISLTVHAREDGKAIAINATIFREMGVGHQLFAVAL
jgi:hypothetical protein